jgi:hypothetical protein
MPGANEVIDNVGRGCIPTSAAEPFTASKTSDNTARVVNATVSKQKALVSSVPTIVENLTHAQACAGSSFSSSGLGGPFAPSTCMLAKLSRSSSSRPSDPSSSCRRLLGPLARFRTLSSGSAVEASSVALIAAAEFETRWFPMLLKASMSAAVDLTIDRIFGPGVVLRV